MNFSESDKDFDPSKLNEAQRRTYEAAKLAADPNYVPDPEVIKALGMDSIVARFKIEIMFGKDRTVAGPNACVIQVFESGRRLNGGGDELMYWCKDARQGEDGGCWGPIIGDWIHRGVAHCPSCGCMLNAELLTGQRFMKVTTRRLAEHVGLIWRQLGMEADIYCKYDPGDFRYKITEKKMGAEAARRLRGLFIYPLKNILKDTAAGASVEGRFEALFRA